MNLLLPFDTRRTTDVQCAVDELAEESGHEERGAVYTKPAVVEAILDLAGYTPNKPLFHMRFLEPSFGGGEFMLAAVERLLESVRLAGLSVLPNARILDDSIRAVELHRETFDSTRQRLLTFLTTVGQLQPGPASELVSKWLINDDFLLIQLPGRFNFAVGNPPYVRQEKIPAPLLREYRRRFSTMYDRADLYVPFFERCLDHLTESGLLAFICANRWFKNKYGGPLRLKVARDFHLKYIIDLERADAFDMEVIAYPAITVIEKGRGNKTRIALHGRHDVTILADVVPAMVSGAAGGAGFVEVEGVTNGEDPWLVDLPEILPTVRRLEADFPALTEAGITVGIGVATGHDKVYIGNFENLPVESERKLPLVMPADLRNGQIDWSGKGIVNPWTESGALANLDEFPKFATYLCAHETELRKRHTAQGAPDKWYRTIDRIYPKLTSRPKLLIPDIKGDSTVVYDEGRFYPHHNLYVVTSDTWDLRALQAVLRSSVALMFIAAYSVRMAGGFMRFQAQYLRRIRVPRWSDLTDEQKNNLREVAEATDQRIIDDQTFPIFRLVGVEAQRVRAFAGTARIGRAAK